MGLSTIADLLADSAFTSGTKRNVVAWESAPDRISITGRLKGTRKKGIVVVVKNGDQVTLGVHGPRNLHHSTVMPQDRLDGDSLDRFTKTALADLHAKTAKRTLRRR